MLVLEIKEIAVPLELLEHQEHQVLKVLLAPLALSELQELLALAHLAPLELLEHQVLLEQQAQLVLLERLVARGLQAMKVT